MQCIDLFKHTTKSVPCAGSLNGVLVSCIFRFTQTRIPWEEWTVEGGLPGQTDLRSWHIYGEFSWLFIGEGWPSLLRKWFLWATVPESCKKRDWASVRMDKAISSLPSGFLFQFLLDSLPLTFLDDRISPAIRNQINHFLPLSSFWSHVPHNRKAPRENGWYPALSLALFGWMPFDNIILFFGKFLDLTVTIWFSLS